MPYLELNEEQRLELRSGQTVVGSGAQADWRLPGLDLAARHFEIHVDGASLATVKPHSAHNVVVVNGRQATLQATPLGDGDIIAAGSARFRFLESLDAAPPPEPESQRSRAYLVNERAHKAYALLRRTVPVGRDASSAVLITEPAVSRFHADIRSEAGEHVLYSMGSSGTHVNGQRVVAPRVLEEGDRIEIGDTTLVFTREQPTDVEIVSGSEAEANSVSRATQQHRTLEGVQVGKPRSSLGPPVLGLLALVVLVIVLLVWLL